MFRIYKWLRLRSETKEFIEIRIPSLISISSLKADAELDGLRHSAEILRETIKGINI